MLRAVVMVSSATLSACGGGGGESTPPDATPKECKQIESVDVGDFPLSIETMPKDACAAGAFKNYDFNGTWFLQGDTKDPFAHSATRIDETCDDGTAVRNHQQTARTDDFIFWTSMYEFGQNYSYQVASYGCSRNPNGSFNTVTITCQKEGNQDWACGSGQEYVAIPLTRIAGESDSENFALVGRTPTPSWATRFIANVRVSGDYAYMAAGNAGMRVIDISDETNPKEVAQLTLDQEFINDIKLTTAPNGTLYALLAGQNGLYFVSLADPLTPEWKSIATINSGVHTLFLDTVGGVTKAYLADSTNPRVDVVEVTDPENWKKLGAFNLTGTSATRTHDLFVENGRAYLCSGDSFVVADIANAPGQSTIVGEWVGPQPLFSHSAWVTTVNGRRIAVHGGEGYNAHIRIIDVDPNSQEFMQVIGTFKLREEVSVHNIMAFGNKAYVAYYQDGVRVLDLSDPTKPTQIGHYHTWNEEESLGTWLEGAAGIDIDRSKNRLYVADYPSGLLILEDQTP